MGLWDRAAKMELRKRTRSTTGMYAAPHTDISDAVCSVCQEVASDRDAMEALDPPDRRECLDAVLSERSDGADDGRCSLPRPGPPRLRPLPELRVLARLPPLLALAASQSCAPVRRDARVPDVKPVLGRVPTEIPPPA